MAKYKVVITDTVFEAFDAEKEVLAAVDAGLVVLQCKSAEELLPRVADAHAMLNTYLPGIDDTVFAAAPNLKAVVRYGIGVDTIDVDAATRRGIVVANVPDYCIEEVADHALAHFLNAARKIALANQKIREGEWSLSYVKPLKAIDSMTVGIIGFGRCGRAIAKRVRGFDPKVVFADPCIADDMDGCEKVSLDTLFAVSDAIFVQCPSNEATYHLLNQEAFEKMQKTPIIINCARGAIVDTEALVWALETGRVSAAGLDVLEDEKAVVEADHPLKTFDTVTLTPHSAWYSGAAIAKLQRKAAEEVARVLRGEPPLSWVNAPHA